MLKVSQPAMSAGTPGSQSSGMSTSTQERSSTSISNKTSNLPTALFFEESLRIQTILVPIGRHGDHVNARIHRAAARASWQHGGATGAAGALSRFGRAESSPREWSD